MALAAFLIILAGCRGSRLVRDCSIGMVTVTVKRSGCLVVGVSSSTVGVRVAVRLTVTTASPVTTASFGRNCLARPCIVSTEGSGTKKSHDHRGRGGCLVGVVQGHTT